MELSKLLPFTPTELEIIEGRKLTNEWIALVKAPQYRRKRHEKEQRKKDKDAALHKWKDDKIKALTYLLEEKVKVEVKYRD